MGGGISGNTEGVEDNQSSSESSTEWGVWFWDSTEEEGKIGVSVVLVGGGKSSSKVTH